MHPPSTPDSLARCAAFNLVAALDSYVLTCARLATDWKDTDSYAEAAKEIAAVRQHGVSVPGLSVLTLQLIIAHSEFQAVLWQQANGEADSQSIHEVLDRHTHAVLELRLAARKMLVRDGSPMRSADTLALVEHDALAGQSILVIEDDYHLASDMARLLQDGGAHVVGPCASVGDAREAVADTHITGAVLDIYLRDGRSFDIARQLKAASKPFLFITGYDPAVIPDDLATVVCLPKPVQPGRVVAELADALAA